MSKRRCLEKPGSLLSMSSLDSNAEITHQALAQVRVVCRNGPEVLRFPHVVKILHEFLDWTNEVLLYKACKANFQYLVSRKLEIYAQESAKSQIFDPRFRQWQFSQAMVNSVECGNLAFIVMLSNHFSGCHVPKKVFQQAAKLGRSEILEWLDSNRSDSIWDENVVGFAVSGEHFELAKWLKERVETTTLYMMGMWAILAADKGNLDMLKWVCSFSEEIDLKRPLRDAIDNGHLDVVKWIVPQIDTEADNFHFDVDDACLHEHYEVVEWLVQHYPSKCCFAFADRDAARRGRLDIVRLLHTNNVSGCSKRIIDCAALRGHLDIVKWLQSCSHKTSHEYSEYQAIDDAASNGHLEIVQWLHENTDEGCSTKAMNSAAFNNHFETIQWLHEHRTEGCTEVAMDHAAFNGNLQLVQWFSENRTEGCTTSAMDLAACRGHLEVVKWLHENREEGCTTDAMDNAAKYGHLDVVKWLHETRNEGCTTKAMDGAAERGYLDIVQWLHENRSEGCTTKAMDGAAKNQLWDVVHWLDCNRPEGATVATMVSMAHHGNMDGIIWGYYIGPTPCNASVVVEAVLSGHFAIARFLHQEQEWSECDVIPALRECSNENRRWEFAEWMHLHYQDEFESIAEEVFADPPPVG